MHFEPPHLDSLPAVHCEARNVSVPRICWISRVLSVVEAESNGVHTATLAPNCKGVVTGVGDTTRPENEYYMYVIHVKGNKASQAAYLQFSTRMP